MITFFTSWQNEMLLDRLTGSLNDFIGFNNGGLFITPDNRETVFADIEAAPFTLDKISAFTGTQPQPAEFYADLHQQGIVAIQSLFGTQEIFNSTSIDNLNNQQRESLFTSVYADGGAGTDRFWIANAQIPQSANTITDFTISEDVIGIAGVDIAFADLNLIQNEANTLISVDGNNLAILFGVETDSLSANNFVFV